MRETELVSWALQGNQEAVECFELLAKISQIFDDVWDGDNAVDREQALQMMLMAMVDLPLNDFYQVMGGRMLSAIENTWLRWVESNDLEATGKEDLLRISYITRSTLTDLLIEMAGWVGGNEWRRLAAGRIRSEIYKDNEPFSEYLKEHTGERDV